MMAYIRKSLSGKGGFTLVEVIVVAVIVAVLAAVAIPLYNNYITNSKARTVANTAASLASFLAAGRAVASTDAIPGAVAALATITCTDPAGGVTTFTMPAKMAATIVGSYAAGGNVTVTHADAGVPATPALTF